MSKPQGLCGILLHSKYVNGRVYDRMTDATGETLPQLDKDYRVLADGPLPSKSWEEDYLPTPSEIVEDIFARIGRSEELDIKVNYLGKTVLMRDFHNLYPSEAVVQKSLDAMLEHIYTDPHDEEYLVAMKGIDDTAAELLKHRVEV